MSHNDQHHHLSSPGSAVPDSSSPTEYGVALPRPDTPFSHSPRGVLSTTDTSVAATDRAAAAVVDQGEAMKRDPDRITLMERWAINASDSQFHALAGAIGGFTSGIVTCPLDVIKTKLQAQGGFTAVQKGRHVGHQRIYKGLGGTASIIWKEEGLRGLYRGLGPIIMGYLPTWAVWFTVYNKSKIWMSQYQQNTIAINLWSSIIAGASSTIATNPIWVIKTRLMSQAGHHGRPRFSVFPKGSNTPTSRPTLHSPWHYRSTLDAARKMYTTEGITSFYSGLTPALLGLTHVAVQFPAYEYLKTKFTGRPMGAAPAEGQDDKAHWLGVLSASILSKIMASSATYPHEVIRTRLQTQRKPMPGQEYLQGLGTPDNGTAKQPQQVPKYKGIASTCRTILREEGWRAFYAGMGTNMMRAVPAATVTMLTYEYVMRQLNTMKAHGKERQQRLERKEIDGYYYYSGNETSLFGSQPNRPRISDASPLV